MLEEVRSIGAGGGFGSIIGRNAFQRPREQALALLERVCDIHLGRP
jgi:class I fructose-bisphosphate aldolase